jgi:ribonuclease Z
MRSPPLAFDGRLLTKQTYAGNSSYPRKGDSQNVELHFLGTGAGLPSKQRNVTSIVLDLLPERGSCWMFDCGEGTQHQLLHSPLKLSKVDKLFVTHLHGDHIFGIPGILSSRSFQGNPGPLTLYGPVGLRRFVDACLDVSTTHLTYAIEVCEIADDSHLVFEDDDVIVTARWLAHGIPSLGYRVEERDRPGVFFPERAKAAGVAPGPLYAKLQAGHSVTTADGRTVHPQQVMGPPRAGRKLAILGDTRPCPQVLELAQDVDVLVHEATFGQTEANLAHSYHHSTTVEAAEAAKASHAHKLILTHISARYGPDDVHKLEAEANDVFPAAQFAYDFLTVPVPFPDAALQHLHQHPDR